MGEAAADTQREIGELRGDMDATLDEVEGRLRGGVRGVASVETRIKSLRARDELARRARENPALVGVAVASAAGAATYAAYVLVVGLRERRKPRRRAERAFSEFRTSLGDRIHRMQQQAEEARQRGLLVKLEPQAGGYMRVSDARPGVMARDGRERTMMLKKLVWAALASVLMAVGSVLSRRAADRIWRATVHEEPPEQASKAAA